MCCRSMFELELQATPPHNLLRKELALLRVTSIDSQQLLQSLLGNIYEMMGGNMEEALEVLVVLPREIRDSQRRSQAMLLKPLVDCREQILALLDQAMEYCITRTDCAEPSRLIHQICRALHAWVDLPSIQGGMPEYQIGTFFCAHKTMFGALLKICMNDSELFPCIEAASEALISMLKATCPQDSDAEGTCAALHEIAAALVQCTCTIPSMNETRALVISEIGSALGDCWTEGIAGKLQFALELGELMLACLQREESLVAESAAEYFFAINLVDFEQRIHDLGTPLHAKLIEVIWNRMKYPLDMNNVLDLCDDDAYCRLREVVMPELLQESYMILRNYYLEFVLNGIHRSQTWQELEGSMYLIRASGLQIRTRALLSCEISNVEMTHEVARTNDLLSQIFWAFGDKWKEKISESNSINNFNLLGLEFSKTIQSFAVWLGKQKDGSSLQAMCGILFDTLQISDAAVVLEGSKAIKTICMRCSERFKGDRDGVSAMILTIQSRMTYHSERAGEGYLMEGMVHIAAALPPPWNTECLIRITQPLIERIQYCISAEFNLESHALTVHNLMLFSKVFKALLPSALADKEAGGVAATKLFANLQPLLSQIIHTEKWKDDPEILQGILEVCKESVCSGRDSSIQILPELCPLVATIFQTTYVPSALDVISEIIEMHFENAEMMNGIMQMSLSAFQEAFTMLGAKGLESNQALVIALMEIAYTFLVYCPHCLMDCGALGSFLDLAIASLASKESDAVVSTMQFLSYIPTLANCDDLADKRTSMIIIEEFTQRGGVITEALLHALCESSPRQNMRSVANLIRTILVQQNFKDMSMKWLHESLQSPKIHKLCFHSQSDESFCAKFYQLATSRTLRPQRLACLILDFGLIARGEEDVDVLLSYEL